MESSQKASPLPFPIQKVKVIVISILLVWLLLGVLYVFNNYLKEKNESSETKIQSLISI